MNLWVYTLLIVALVVLLGVTLYARFAHRSRSKSLHHAPVRVRFPSTVISAAPDDAEDDLDFGQIFRHATEATEATEATAQTEPLELPLPALPSQPEDRAATEYLDELQEAAAGLALLMRSAAPWKAEPVVYAPEGAEDSPIQNTAVGSNELATIEPLAPQAAITLDEDITSRVQVRDEVLSPAPPIERRELIVLGEQVCLQFTQIDEGLDDLEALISSIEASLSAWSESPGIEDSEAAAWDAAA
jgi:hypothetical protein